MNPEPIPAEGHPDEVDSSVCPECGHAEIDTRWENRPFPYGSGPDAVEIPVRLPVRVCRKCGFQFFDEEAEDLRYEAVCRHLGVLTPREIKELREKSGLSRAEFARLTRLGEATIARWERGALIQNAANDCYLRLLAANSDNLRILRELAGSSPPPPPEPDRFRRLGSADLERYRRNRDQLLKSLNFAGSN